MGSRGYWESFGMIAGYSTFPMILLSSLIHSLVWDIKYSQALPFGIFYGISFGLLFGLIGALYIKTLTISIPLKDRVEFYSKLNITLAELGYHPESQTGNFFTYRPSFQAGLLSGKISIQIENCNAEIIGPNMYIKKLQKILNEQ